MLVLLEKEGHPREAAVEPEDGVCDCPAVCAKREENDELSEIRQEFHFARPRLRHEDPPPKWDVGPWR